MNTNTQAILTTSSPAPTATKTQQINKTDSNYTAKFCIYKNVINSRINTSLSIAARQMHAILIALICIISMGFAPWGTAHAMGDAVKWHPGHYYTIMNWGKNNPKYLEQVYSELSATPALRGLQIRYTWAELEPKWGVYDFTAIDKRLTELTKQKKRLIILLQTKSFDTESALVPDYLNADKFEGGVFAISKNGSTVHNGHGIKLWNRLVRYRLIELVRALGEHYNLHPYFEGIGFTETAMGQPMVALSNDQYDTYYKNLLSINQQMRNNFPNTMTFQFTNYPRPILEQFVGRLKEMGTALGGPDVFIEDPDLNMKDQPYIYDGIYSYYPKSSGTVPLTPSVMPQNYRNTRHDKTGYEPTVFELLSFARDQLKANYIFWTRTPEDHEEVLQVLNWKNQTSDPAGGLNSTCPTAYSSCVD